jgi:hypothetical protein
MTLVNLRDVGGTPLPDGASVRSGILLRGDAPWAGDAAPASVVWPPQTVIDLRSTAEVGESHPLAGNGVAVHAISLSKTMSVGDMAAHDDMLVDGLPGLYRTTLASSGATIARVVALIAEAEPPVLVHCAAGKDRTGLVIAVTLGAVGASREAIVADYVKTDANMPRVLERMTADGRPAVGTLQRLAREHPDALHAPAEAIAAALDVIDDAGGARAWLREQGLSEGTLARLDALLTG